MHDCLSSCERRICEILKMFRPKYKRNSDIRYLKNLYFVNALCGFVPFYDFEARVMKTGFFYKLHPVCMVLVRIAISVFLLEEMWKLSVNLQLVPLVLFCIENFIIAFVSIVPTFELTFRKKDTLRELFASFHKSDETMLSLNENKSEDHFDTFVLELVLFQILYTGLIATDLWLKSGFTTSYSFTVVGAVIIITNQLFLYLMCNFALALRSRFKYLNESIVGLKKCDFSTMMLKSMQVHDFFAGLLDVVYMYNDLFGWSILLYIAAMFVGFLQCFANLIAAGEVDEFALENFAAILTLLVMGIVLMVCGNLTNSEIKNTQHVSLKTISHLPGKSVSSKFIGYVGMQISLEQPQLTAADLFPLTLSTMLTILGSLTSYMIIIIQFYKH